jgi:MFS family permease
VYLTTVAHASAAVGAYCVTGFAATMALGRLTGDAVVRRFGPVTTVRAGGALAVLGAVAIVAARTPWLGIAGFAAMGLGIATGVPLCIAAAGRATGDSDTAVAGISSITYGSGLLAGPSVGALGSAVSLPFAFGLVALLATGISLARCGPVPAPPRPPPSSSPRRSSGRLADLPAADGLRTFCGTRA